MEPIEAAASGRSRRGRSDLPDATDGTTPRGSNATFNSIIAVFELLLQCSSLPLGSGSKNGGGDVVPAVVDPLPDAPGRTVEALRVVPRKRCRTPVSTLPARTRRSFGAAANGGKRLLLLDRRIPARSNDSQSCLAAGVAWPQRRSHDHDRHPRFEPRRPRRPQSGRFTMTGTALTGATRKPSNAPPDGW